MFNMKEKKYNIDNTRKNKVENIQYIEKKGMDFFKKADIIINGSRPWDIQVHNDKFFKRLLRDGSIAWDCKAIDQMVYKALRANLYEELQNHIFRKIHFLKTLVTNQQSKSRATRDVQFHYDLGVDLFENMLDNTLNYTCGYWKDAKTLGQAQIAKMDLVCKKLKLKKGMHILDIGCGFGGFAKFAAQKYKVKVTGITLSKDQAKVAQKRCKNLNVEILLQDYRNHEGKYDRIVSIGMIEAVGYKNQRAYFKMADRCLKSQGLFLVHTIGTSNPLLIEDPWLGKYVFPGTMIPTVKQLSVAAQGIFFLEDWHNFGLDYHITTKAWFNNFDKNWPKLKNKYDERFYRMWKYYLLACSGGFKSKNMHLWQIVFSKTDYDSRYQR